MNCFPPNALLYKDVVILVFFALCACLYIYLFNFCYLVYAALLINQIKLVPNVIILTGRVMRLIQYNTTVVQI